MLDTSIFSFIHNVFYPIKTKNFILMILNPFPHDKISDQTKLKAFADNKLNVTKMIISVFDRVQNMVGKGEIACTSNFSFSHLVFKGLLSQRRQKVLLCGNGLNVVCKCFQYLVIWHKEFILLWTKSVCCSKINHQKD